MPHKNGCTYKGTEPSPKGLGMCAHLLSPNTAMKGRDGNLWAVAVDRMGRKSWRKLGAAAAAAKQPPNRQQDRRNPTKTKPCPPGKIVNPATGRCVLERRRRKTPNPRPSPNPRPPPSTHSPKSASTAFIQPMLAQKYDPRMDPGGMWASEKLDGVRAVLVNGTFFSRNGNVYRAPAWFVDAMPRNTTLDGELYTKSGDFQRIMSIVRKTRPVDSEWRSIKYMAFDIPVPNVPFEKRYDELRRIVRQASSPYLVLVENERVKSRAHLDEMHKKVMAKGGEGIILRLPGSVYENKRTSSLLKVKADDDDEAVVIGQEYGRGKNAHRMGKLVVQWKHSKEPFHVGSGFTDKQRQDYKRLFPVGTIIKIKYNGMTDSKKPRFPIFLGIRDAKDMDAK